MTAGGSRAAVTSVRAAVGPVRGPLAPDPSR